MGSGRDGAGEVSVLCVAVWAVGSQKVWGRRARELAVRAGGLAVGACGVAACCGERPRPRERAAAPRAARVGAERPRAAVPSGRAL